MRSLSPARWAFRRRAPMNFCMRTAFRRCGSAAGLSYRRSSSVSGWSDRREAHMKNKYLSARVSRVWRLCPVFRTQPGAYPPETQKPDAAPTCGRTRNSAEVQRSGFGRKRKCGGMDETYRLRQMREIAENGQNRGILDAAARKRRESRTKLRGRARLRSGHNCPPCGQFRGFTRAFQKTQKSAMGCCRMKKARRFKEYSGVPTKDTR